MSKELKCLLADIDNNSKVASRFIMKYPNRYIKTISHLSKIYSKDTTKFILSIYVK